MSKEIKELVTVLRRAGYDKSADALEALAGERDRLKAALEDAKEMVISWGSYAPTYFAEKHDLLGDVERLNKALGGAS